MTGDPHILWLDQEGAPDNPLLGGKFASLAAMTAAGFAVPPGFGVTTTAYRVFMARAGLDGKAAFVREAARREALADVGSARTRLVEAIGAAPMPDELETAIRRNYGILEERTGRAAVPVAVRSSGEAEDLADASFAGQYDTYLWITGADAVLRQIRACWASMFGDTALSYRAGVDDAASAGGDGICVGVQQMVEARAAGVMFTLDPLKGDRSKIVMEACWGLGEGVVKGDVTPSRFTVDKVTLEIVQREIVPQAEEYRFDAASGRVRLMPLPSEQGQAACIEDAEALALAKLAKRIEGHRGAAQDIEWAIGSDGEVGILQVRPETVWSQRESAGLVTESRSAVGHVLARLSGGRVATAGPGQRDR
ncbi:MAG: PEP/pyruvate-binding domain-containing protein [Rhodospirillaceae bacterium]|nr:PEP/pyruvate-binding domain-containing protein [Rhodospirillaceae bacterium]